MLALITFVNKRVDFATDIPPMEVLADRFFCAVGAWVTQIYVIPLYDWYKNWFRYKYFLILWDDFWCSNSGCSVAIFKLLNKFQVTKVELQRLFWCPQGWDFHFWVGLAGSRMSALHWVTSWVGGWVVRSPGIATPSLSFYVINELWHWWLECLCSSCPRKKS